MKAGGRGLDYLLTRLCSGAHVEEGCQEGIGATRNYWVIPGQHGPRWIVPCQPEFGVPVLSQWQPYSFVSRVKWAVVKFFYRNSLLGRVPGIQHVEMPPSTLADSGGLGEAFPVVYIGTPGPQQKAVVTLVNSNKCQAQAVMKVALAEGAYASINREAEALKTLADQNVQGVPQLLWVGAKGDRSCQSVVNGSFTGRSLTRAHVDWLLSLPRSDQEISIDKLQNKADAALQKIEVFSRVERASIIRGLDGLRGKGQLFGVLVHGDFAPWNLKLKADGKIAAVDWEEACFNGMPLHDISHFFMIQAHLFGGKSPSPTMASNPLVKNYLAGMDLDFSALKPLLLYYLVLMVTDNGGDCSASYRMFLNQQIKCLV